MKVVLDCNVLISAGITEGTCRKLLLELVERHQIFLSQPIIDEYLEVSKRPKFKEAQKKLQSIFKILLGVATLVEPAPCPFQLPDPLDEVYLATALTAKANSLITGNKRHFPDTPYKKVHILRPREFLEQIKSP